MQLFKCFRVFPTSVMKQFSLFASIRLIICFKYHVVAICLILLLLLRRTDYECVRHHEGDFNIQIPLYIFVL